MKFKLGSNFKSLNELPFYSKKPSKHLIKTSYMIVILHFEVLI